MSSPAIAPTMVHIEVHCELHCSGYANKELGRWTSSTAILEHDDEVAGTITLGVFITT